MEKDDAFKIYSDIVRKMQDPALLEYAGTKMFKLRIFPIEPKSDKVIKLQYSELINCENSICKYVYPLNTEKFSSMPLKDVSVSVDISSKTPIKSVFSSSHTVDITRSGDNNIIAGFEGANITPDKDFILYYTLSKKDIGLNIITYKENKNDGYFVMMLAPKIQTDDSKIIPKDFIFVIDTSGSMAGAKLIQAKKALSFCLKNLKSFDRFNILRYSTGVVKFHNDLTAASTENINKGLAFVDALESAGGTNINDALLEAISLNNTSGDEIRPFMTLILTDGLPTIGEVNINKILKNVSSGKTSNLRLFSYGVGSDVNTHLLEKLANQNKGFCDYSLRGENLEIKLSAFYSKISEPVLSDIQLEFPKEWEVYDMYPKQISDLFKGSQVICYGRYKGKDAGAIKLVGQRNDDKIELTFENTLPAINISNNLIPKLWATSKVGYLMEQIRLNGENSELKEEIIRLSKKYGIITPYTSYLVQEDRNAKDFSQNRAGGGAPVIDEEESDEAFDVKASPSNIDKKPNTKTRQSANELKSDSGSGSIKAGKSLKKLKEGKIQNNRQDINKTQTIGSKTFYFSKGIWYDSEYNKKEMKEKTIKIKYLSKEYFDLIGIDFNMKRYLSLGKNIIIIINDKVYEIYEE